MIVTLVRKPLEGSVIANSVAWGSAGVNVDACRITTAPWDAKAMERVNSPGSGRNRATHGGRETPEGRWDGPIGTGVMDTTQGRFPANLVMTHLTGCTLGVPIHQKGVQIAVGSVGFGHDREDGYVTGKGRQYAPDVLSPSWQCLDGCPVKGLDTQTGILAPAGGSKHTTHADGMFGIGQPGVTYKDTGGASRFFKNLKLSPSVP
jgi:hypothetical protein